MMALVHKQARNGFPEQHSPTFWKGQWGRSVTLVLLVLLAVAIALWQTVPPNVVPASAPATEFSAERAMQQLQVIAQVPHPTGSAANATVRSELVSQLKAMGLQPEVQTTTVVQAGEGGFGAGTVHNVIARIPGTASTGAIALNAHYDSADTGPGASDCGSCVVTVLETVRAIRADAPLKNDVVIIFTDGEENGMLGAHAFATEHPWSQDIKLALNFEATGSRGASVLYITSRNNQRLIEEFVKAVPYPRMSSFSPAFWSFFPQAQAGCDLDEYLAKGSAGLGFYYTGNIPVYHTKQDNVQTIDPRSIQHNGSYTLAAVQHFGHLNLSLLSAKQNAVYFNFLPNGVIHYPEAQVLPLMLVTTVLFIGVIYFGYRYRQLTFKGVAWSAIAFFGSAIGVVLFDVLLWWLFLVLTPSLQVFLIGDYQMNLYQAGFICLTLAILAGIYTALLRRWQWTDLAIGALLVWTLLMIASSLFMPGASYLLTVPLLVSLLAWLWILLADRSIILRSWKVTLLFSGVALVGIILWLPIQVYYFISWMARFEALLDLPLSAISMLFTALLFGIFIPPLAILLSSLEVADLKRSSLSAIGLLLSVVLLSVATANSGFSVNQPRPNSMTYVLDVDRGQASWISRDRQIDSWTSQFLTPKAKMQKVEFGLFLTASPGFSAPAPVVNLPPLAVSRLTSGSQPTLLRLRIRSPRQAAIAEVGLSAQASLKRATLNNKPLDLSAVAPEQRQTLKLLYFGLPPEGIELTLEFATPTSVQLSLKDYAWGLPAIPGMVIPQRPATMMPAPAHPDYTIVQHQVTLSSLDSV